MDDLISRYAAINAIENTDCELSSDDWDELTDAIMSVPTADAVEVVRCKDCEYGKPKGECFYCTYEGHIHTDEFYCAHGEKKVYKPWKLKERK